MTTIRSFLFIPGDSQKKIQKGLHVGADAVILDLEDAVSTANKAAARDLVATCLQDKPAANRECEIWVRVNPLTSGMILDDLQAVIPFAPDGLVLPKPDSPLDVRAVAEHLDELELANDLTVGQTRVLPVATETAIAPFHLGEYATAKIDRLAGLTWGAEDLATALGASRNRDADGQWLKTFEIVRSLTLLAAHAAGVAAIDTLYANFKDEAGLRASSIAARSEGFTGRLAIHPAQVAPINESFTPSAEEIDEAHRIVAAFAAADGAGAIGFDGRMLDVPHLKHAQKTIAQAKARQ